MAQRNERTVLNHLIETCRDAERGFRMAASEVRTPELKRLFLGLAAQRHAFATDLLPYAQRLGGASVGDGSAAATLHRGWMHVRLHFATDPDRVALEEAARGEQFAAAAYREAVRELVPPEARELIEAQGIGVRVAQQLVTEMAVS